jgi:monoamine oxidase
MSRIIIVKLERIGGGELLARNFDRRYEQRITMSAELIPILRDRTTVFAEARLRASGELVILRRARDRSW